jgi:hypothetical protein
MNRLFIYETSFLTILLILKFQPKQLDSNTKDLTGEGGIP